MNLLIKQFRKYRLIEIVATLEVAKAATIF